MWANTGFAPEGVSHLYIRNLYTPSYYREEKEARCPTLHHVSRVLFVVLMGRDTDHQHLLAPNLLTGGKGVDLVIRDNVVLNACEGTAKGWVVSASHASSAPLAAQSFVSFSLRLSQLTSGLIRSISGAHSNHGPSLLARPC
jgi:hypothetical protein